MRKCKFLVILFVWIGMIFTIPNSQVGAETDNVKEIVHFLDQKIEEQIAQVNIPNAAVSVVYKDETIFEKGYGYANMETETPVDPEKSLFRIGSVSKLFTWTAVMQLVEQGKLRLEADIYDYLDLKIPDLTGYPPITLRSLSTHTPGFEDYSDSIFRLKEEELLPLHDYVREYLPERVFPSDEIMAYPY